VRVIVFSQGRSKIVFWVIEPILRVGNDVIGDFFQFKLVSNDMLIIIALPDFFYPQFLIGNTRYSGFKCADNRWDRTNCRLTKFLFRRGTIYRAPTVIIQIYRAPTVIIQIYRAPTVIIQIYRAPTVVIQNGDYSVYVVWHQNKRFDFNTGEMIWYFIPAIRHDFTEKIIMHFIVNNLPKDALKTIRNRHHEIRTG